MNDAICYNYGKLYQPSRLKKICCEQLSLAAKLKNEKLPLSDRIKIHLVHMRSQDSFEHINFTQKVMKV